MSKDSKRNPRRQWQIALGCLVLTLAFGVLPPIVITIINRNELFRDPLPVEILPNLPMAAIGIEGIETDGFYDSYPLIRLTDGVVYGLPWSANGRVWIPFYPTPIQPDTSQFPCRQDSLAQFEATGEVVADCLSGWQVGEWCRAPRVSYAITESGRVLELLEPQPCFLGVWIALGIYVPCLAVFMLLVGLIWLAVGRTPIDK